MSSLPHGPLPRVGVPLAPWARSLRAGIFACAVSPPRDRWARWARRRTCSHARPHRRSRNTAAGCGHGDPAGFSRLLQQARWLRVLAGRIVGDRRVPRVDPPPSGAECASWPTWIRRPAAAFRLGTRPGKGGRGGPDRPGHDNARCRTSHRQHDGRQRRLMAGHGDGTMRLVRHVVADGPVAIPGVEHGDVECAITRKQREGARADRPA